MRALIRASVLVDWHNTELIMRNTALADRHRFIQYVLLRIQEEAASVLKRRDATVRYRATVRLYHGWHVEDRATDIRLQFDRLANVEFFGRTVGIVSFNPEFKFGNELACETPRNPIFSTSRPQGQKMVDTAIICDLLYLLGTRAADVGLIVSDDDDFIPAVFTAEAWGLESILLRSPGRTIEHVSKMAPGRLVCHWRSG